MQDGQETRQTQSEFQPIAFGYQIDLSSHVKSHISFSFPPLRSGCPDLSKENAMVPEAVRGPGRTAKSFAAIKGLRFSQITGP
jgi:hypothetical protein